MAVKIITKRVHDVLDSFMSQNQVIPEQYQEVPGQNTLQSKKLKKNDGLIERVDISKKMYIAEDNRQLLQD